MICSSLPLSLSFFAIFCKVLKWILCIAPLVLLALVILLALNIPEVEENERYYRNPWDLCRDDRDNRR